MYFRKLFLFVLGGFFANVYLNIRPMKQYKEALRLFMPSIQKSGLFFPTDSWLLIEHWLFRWCQSCDEALEEFEG